MYCTQYRNRKGKEMAQYRIRAQRIQFLELFVEATSAEEAEKFSDDYITDDFTEIGGEFEILEIRKV